MMAYPSSKFRTSLGKDNMVVINTRTQFTEYHENLLTKAMEWACGLLYLRVLPLVFNNENNCSYDDEGGYIEIGMNYHHGSNYKDCVLPYLKTKPENYSEDLLYTLFHELGHYVQVERFCKWLARYGKFYGDQAPRMSALEYRKLNSERKADLMADILLRKYKREVGI